MNFQNTPLILASASPRRKELLTRLGVPFEIRVADIDEAPLAGETPLEMTERLAQSKAEVIAGKLMTPAWVLGSDTTVALNDQVFGKPDSQQQAIETLQSLSGQTHQVISSISLVNTDKGITPQTKSVVSQVRFGPITTAQIMAYCNTDEPYDKAGSYGIQGLAGSFVEHIEGDYSAIMGLPLWATSQLLRSVGLLREALNNSLF